MSSYPQSFAKNKCLDFLLNLLLIFTASIGSIHTFWMIPDFLNVSFFFLFFFFCQNVTWNFHTSLFMKLCNQISKEIHAHKLFWFSASPLPCLHYILAYHWHENSKNVCVVSMLYTQANSFILRCNEQYILQGMPNKQDQQSQTNMSFTHIWV